MSLEQEKFSKEIETLKRIVNGYLASDPLLAGYQLDALTLVPKKDEKNRGAKLLEVEESSSITFEKLAEAQICCMNSSGKQYTHYGFQCPDGDARC